MRSNNRNKGNKGGKGGKAAVGKGEGTLFFSRTWDFLERYMPLQAGRSPHTVESYRDSLSVFRRWLEDERGLGVGSMTFGDCTRDLVLSFLEWLRARGRSAGTCNQRLAAIRSYVWYAADDDVAVQSVALALDRIPRVKGPVRVREVLGGDELAAVLSAPDPSTARGVRDRAMLALLYDTGIRLSELVGLRVSDVWLDDEPRVFVTGKGRKERFVAIGATTVDHIRCTLECNHGPEPDPSAPLFFTVYGGKRRPMSSSNVQRIVARCADEARSKVPTVPESVYPHMLRRTRATDLYQGGAEIELVSAVLGHEKVETTRVYAKPSTERMREVMEAASPVPAEAAEKPLWVGREEELARLYGLRL